MKLKNLRKKVRRLEKRLQEGPKKLAKLRRKLEAIETAKAKKAKKKSAARVERLARLPTLLPQSKRSPSAGRAAAKKRSVVKRAKRKLNLSPERREQLAAAMKARWAAKRASAETMSKPADQAPAFEATLEPPERRQNGG